MDQALANTWNTKKGREPLRETDKRVTAGASGPVAASDGRLLKCIGGFYYVLPDNGGAICECRARGKFRLDGVAPRAGDRVRIEIAPGETKGGYLVDVYPRQGLLVRPPVANVTQFVLVISASKPLPDFLLADRLLIQAERRQVKPLIAINKCDEADASLLERILRDYAALPYRFLTVSAHTGENLPALRQALLGEVSCFAGQSAVGKSSLLNAICQRLSLETGGITRKTGRGKHTTRVAELWPLDDAPGSFVVDTPGFSLLELDDMEPDELMRYYPEMRGIDGCRFDNCLHQTEPDCAVKTALAQNRISQGRYDRYSAILNELIEAKRTRYS